LNTGAIQEASHPKAANNVSFHVILENLPTDFELQENKTMFTIFGLLPYENDESMNVHRIKRYHDYRILSATIPGTMRPAMQRVVGPPITSPRGAGLTIYLFIPHTRLQP
jgi:hypothetical protein